MSCMYVFIFQVFFIGASWWLIIKAKTWCTLKNKVLPKYICEWRVLFIHLTDIYSEIHRHKWKPSYPLIWGWKQTQFLSRWVPVRKSTTVTSPESK
jgi:hypothetical protein